MLKSLFRRAAPVTHAQLIRRAAPWALAGLACLPVAHAADTRAADEPARSSAPASPFDRYQAWRDEPLRDWREANDRVGDVGGWRVYLRESQEDGSGGQGQHGHHRH